MSTGAASSETVHDVERKASLSVSSRRVNSAKSTPAGSVSSLPTATATATANANANADQAADSMWSDQLLKAAVADLDRIDRDGSDSELSDNEHFLSKGAFLLTPSHELSMDKAGTICEKMNFKGLFSLTKTATGILFKFSDPEDYQATYKKGFHKVTGARFYKKVPIPCRPQKTFTVFVLEVPEDIPEEDIRHSLYKFSSIVEVTRIKDQAAASGSAPTPGSASASSAPNPGTLIEKAAVQGGPPPLIRVTLANLEESNILLQNGLDFYGATYFPTELASAPSSQSRGTRKSIVGNRIFDVVTSTGQRVRDLLPVFDAAGFTKIPPPASKTIKPHRGDRS